MLVKSNPIIGVSINHYNSCYTRFYKHIGVRETNEKTFFKWFWLRLNESTTPENSVFPRIINVSSRHLPTKKSLLYIHVSFCKHNFFKLIKK